MRSALDPSIRNSNNGQGVRVEEFREDASAEVWACGWRFAAPCGQQAGRGDWTPTDWMGDTSAA